MATHLKKIDPSVNPKILVFTDNASSGGVTFSSGDYIAVQESLGRSGSGMKVIIRGTAVVELLLNATLKNIKFNEEEADTTIGYAESLAKINSFILVAGQYDFDFPISKIKIVAYSGGGSSSNNTTFIVY